MPAYTYTAASDTGKVIKGTSFEPDEGALEQHLEQEGMTLVRVVRVHDKPAGAGRFSRVRRNDLIELAYHISVMSAAGIPLITGLEDFAKQRATPRFRGMLEGIIKDVNNGMLLSEALARRPGAFGKIFINLTKAGETSGSLDVVMERYYKEMEWQGRIRAKLYQALVYPSFLLLALSGLVVLLLTFLLPRIMGVFPEGTLDLPLPTKILIFCSDLIRDHWTALLLLVVLMPLAVKLFRMTERGRYATDSLLMRLPLVGKVVLDISVARFISTFRTLFGSGVEIVRSLEIAGDSSGSSVINARAKGITREIMGGTLLSHAFGKVDEFNSMIKNLINMSEKTGQTAMALERITDYFDTVIPRQVKRMLAVMEPAIIIAAGLVVGFVLVGTILPIFNLYSAI
jgi:type IV pilus assembly protein PilC